MIEREFSLLPPVGERADSSWKSFDSFWSTSGHETPEVDTERYVSYELADLYPEWQQDAHCAGAGHDKYFGNEDEQPTMSIKQVRNAAKLCDVCPVFRECLTHALTQREEYGVWAGTSGRARRRLFTMLDNGDTSIPEIVEVAYVGLDRPIGGADVTALPSHEPWRAGVSNEAPGAIA